MVVLAVDGSTIDETAQAVNDSVRLLGTRRTVLVRSAVQIEDVEEISAVTTRHGVSFLRIVPYTSFVQSGWRPLVATIGYAIDSAIDLPGIDAALFVQELDAAGLLVNAVEFTVSIPPPSASQPGPFRTTVTVLMQTIADGQDWFAALFAAQDMLRAQVG